MLRSLFRVGSAAATANQRPTAAASSRMPVWVSLLMGLLGATVLMAIIVAFIVTVGAVRGKEFSPQTFHQREFVFYQLPLIGWKVSPIHRADVTGPLENHLLTNQLIPVLNRPTEWDLVSEQVGTSSKQVNDAELLIDYLEMNDTTGYSVWLRWSEDHPEYAQVFWPVVARLVRGNLYVHLPPFFRLARQAQDADEFEAQLQAAELKLMRELGDRWLKRDRKDLALDHYQQALALAPDDAELKQKVRELKTSQK